MLVKDIVNHLHKLAPTKLAMSWDNVGLQIGHSSWDVKKILCTLDVTPKAINKAIETGANMIISHHPYIFRAIKGITHPDHLRLIENKIAVLAAHTNLDVVSNGVNTALAERLELEELSFIDNETGADWFHVKVQAPIDNIPKIKEAVFNAGAGKVGNYEHCSHEYEVQGEFIPLKNSNPAIGKLNHHEIVEEKSLNFMVDSFNLNRVIAQMKQAHVYEEVAYQVYKVERSNPSFGLGFIGKLSEPMSLNEFAQFVKEKLEAPSIKLWDAGLENPKIKKVAICGGSGTSLLSKIGKKADVYVSGDFTYHTILDSKLPLIDAGHFYTEQPVFDLLIPYLNELDLEIELFSVNEHEISSLALV